MAKKKCPVCGTVNVVPIMYGMPTLDAMKSAEKGKIALGSCCITDYQPQKHCKDCNTDFDYCNLLGTLPIEYLEFNVGGFFDTSHFIYFDSTRKNKFVRYTSIPGGMFIDLKHLGSRNNECFKDEIKEKVISDSEWLKFMSEIEELEILCWKKKYVDTEICDGTQWNLNLKITGKRRISIYGCNEYPSQWEKLLKIMNKYVGEQIV